MHVRAASFERNIPEHKLLYILPSYFNLRAAFLELSMDVKSIVFWFTARYFR
jgi:hypothetical protein